MDSMHREQIGKAGDITVRNRNESYVEWYSERNGRVVLSLPITQGEVLGPEVDLAALPPRTTHPGLFEDYLRTLSVALRKMTRDPNATVLGITSKGTRPPDESDRN